MRLQFGCQWAPGPIRPESCFEEPFASIGRIEWKSAFDFRSRRASSHAFTCTPPCSTHIPVLTARSVRGARTLRILGWSNRSACYAAKSLYS